MAAILRAALAGLAIAAASTVSAQPSGIDYSTYRSSALDMGSPLNVSSYEAPFANGAMAIVAPGRGKMETYTLSLCQEGRAVCAGSRVGTLSHEGGYTVVRGLFGRTFFLGTGGHGHLEQRNGAQKVLAWNARANGN